ncbi:MAG: hypothetical protein KGL12_12175 [Rhodospirillales bacterium]|nr:hypothetical protein [Rhodospirillales bacterium]
MPGTPLRRRLAHRLVAAAIALSLATALGGCVVVPARPYPAARWVPGHYGPYGGWVRGHWV